MPNKSLKEILSLDELKECFITFEQSKEKLLEIEKKLAVRYNLESDVRLSLIEMDLVGKLVEDELVADWHQAYSSYLDYLTE